MGNENTNRYPLAPHMLAHWERTGRTGELLLPLGGTGRVLRIRYEQYLPPVYFLGDHYLGTVTLDGKPVRVTEEYIYHTVNNSGSVRWKGRASSDDGVCAVSEIVMAVDAGRSVLLEETEPGTWTLTISHRVDQSFHEVEFDAYRCQGTLDLAGPSLILRRRYHRDAST